MAKKTKREKIIAQLRRQILVNQNATHPTTPTPPVQNNTISFTVPSTKKTQLTRVEVSAIDPTFLYRDLAKTAVIAVCLFGVQFFLYWVFEGGGDKVLEPILKWSFRT